MSVQTVGLPIIPAPHSTELLGSWLLRISAHYSVTVPRLLTHVGINAQLSANFHWSRLPPLDLFDIDRLSRALACRPQFIQKMQPGVKIARKKYELAACPNCWQEDVATGRPLFWRHQWMNPLATTCARHCKWLLPVDVSGLQKVSHYDQLSEFAFSMMERHTNDPPFAGASELLRDALALDRALVASTPAKLDRYANLGLDRIDLLHLVVSNLLSMAFFCEDGTDMHGSFAQSVHARLSKSASIATMQFSIRRYDGVIHHYRLPLRLQSRQAVLAYLASLLSPQSAQFIDTSHLRQNERRSLISYAEKWPNLCSRALLPEIAQWIDEDRILRNTFRISPAYFARRKLLDLQY